VRRRALPALALAAAVAALFWPYGPAAVAAVPAAALLGLAQRRVAGIGLANGRLRWRHRTLARSTVVVQARSIQWRRLRQGPFQRRRGLATLEVGLATAGGANARVLDLDEGDAAALVHALGPG
jgi:putative membrane protein